MIAVVNATPLIALALIDRLSLLRDLFDQVLVPAAVHEEVVGRGPTRPGAAAVLNAAWLEIRTPRSSPTIEPLLLGLDVGELQVLRLAQEVQADWVVIDERLGRRVAQAMGLSIKGTVGILLAGRYAGLLTTPQTLDAAQRLAEAGIRIGPKVMVWLQAELDLLADT